MRLTVVDRWRAQEIMCNPVAYPGITHIVSIGAAHPIQLVPVGFDTHPAKKLRLEFFDISCAEREGMNGPSEDDIARLVGFFREMLRSEPEPNILIHCYAGQSRSVAAGLILLAMYYGDGDKAWEELVKIVPEPTPNQRMLELAEETWAKGEIRWTAGISSSSTD